MDREDDEMLTGGGKASDLIVQISFKSWPAADMLGSTISRRESR